MSLLLFIGLTCGTAFLPLLYFLAKAVQDLFFLQQQKRQRAEKRACIRRVQIMNEPGRRVPFVKLKVELFSGGEEGAVADAEGFYPHHEAVRLRPGSLVWVRQRSYGAAEWQVVKKPALPKKSIAPGCKATKGQPFKNRNEENKGFISTGSGPVQSPAAHRRRLAFR